jgi:hypothetical protein
METRKGNTGYYDKKGYPINYGDLLTPLYCMQDYQQVKEYEVCFRDGEAMIGDRTLKSLATAQNGEHAYTASSVRPKPKMVSHHRTDNGAPAGGQTWGQGFAIAWQDGPLGAPHDPERKRPNGAFVEDIIEAVIDRINQYQNSKFRCDENEEALAYLYKARLALDARTQKRISENKEGTHEV